MKTSVLALILLWTASTFARGGMIGGGDVTLRALLECDVASIDQTFGEARYLWVAEEVNEDGERVENTTLRIVTLDKAQKPLAYYVTHESELPSLQHVDISIWRYEAGSSNNRQIGTFQWDVARGTGVFSVEELTVSNCN